MEVRKFTFKCKHCGKKISMVKREDFRPHGMKCHRCRNYISISSLVSFKRLTGEEGL